MKGRTAKSEAAEVKGAMKYKKGGKVKMAKGGCMAAGGSTGKARGMGAATKGGKFTDL
jgi:hypothetical protein